MWCFFRFAVNDTRINLPTPYIFANGLPAPVATSAVSDIPTNANSVATMTTTARTRNQKRINSTLQKQHQRPKRRAGLTSMYNTQQDDVDDDDDDDINIDSDEGDNDDAERALSQDVTSTTTTTTMPKVLMFSLRVTDGDAVADIIVFDKVLVLVMCTIFINYYTLIFISRTVRIENYCNDESISYLYIYIMCLFVCFV